MRNTTFTALVSVLLFCAAGASAAGPLTIVTESWPPYVYEASGTAMGFDYEVVASVFAKMGIDVLVRFYPWKRCVQMMRDQQADAILDAGMSQARKAYLIYPEEPLSSSESVFFFLKANAFTFNDLADLSGKTVGTSLGYQYSDAFNRATHFSKEPVASIEQNFTKLLAGRIDLVIVNRSVGLFKSKEMGIGEVIDHTANPVSGGPLYLAFARKAGAEDLSIRFAGALKRFKRTPAYRNILDKYGQ